MSFYTSLTGLKNAQTDLGVISNNIANAETNGFKKSNTEFADIVAGSAYSNPRLTVGIGSTVERVTQNFSVGPIEQTGGAMDVAINGDGFFTLVSGSTGTPSSRATAASPSMRTATSPMAPTPACRALPWMPAATRPRPRPPIS